MLRGMGWVGWGAWSCARPRLLLFALALVGTSAWNEGRKPTKDACAVWCHYDDSNCVAAFKKDQCAGCDNCKVLETQALQGCDGCTPLCCERLAEQAGNLPTTAIAAEHDTLKAEVCVPGM